MQIQKSRVAEARLDNTPTRGSSAPGRRNSAVHKSAVCKSAVCKNGELSGIGVLQKSANSSSGVSRLLLIQELANSRQPVFQRAGAAELLEEEPAQLARNNTGLPDNLKHGMESMTGHSMDHVRVHYNSPNPSTLQAHAYAQGNEIHLASGQEKHLPHELGHVVQQMEGRVRPTMSVGGVGINDDAGLESEATTLGNKALQY